MALLDRMEAEIVHEQHEAAQPVAHKFVLVSE